MTATRITRPLVQLLLLAFAALITTLGFATSSAHAAPTGPCSGINGCITSLTSAPHFEDATVNVQTSVPTSAKLQYWVWGNRTSVAHTLVHRDPVRAHELTPTNLDQGVIYEGRLTVTALGGSQQVSKLFWQTRKRTLDVTVERIVVHKDGDAVGAGEVRGGVRMFGELDATVLFNVKRVNDGETVWLNKHLTYDKAMPSALADLTLYEEDTDTADNDCNLTVLFPMHSGSDSCGDWASALKGISLSTDTSAAPTSLVLSESAGNLSFTAYLKVAVTLK